MGKIQNLERLVATLRTKAARARKDMNVSVIVGFTTNYALYVHENLAAHHPVGQAKFLEGPARELSNDGTLATITRKVMHEGKTLAEGLVLAGLRLQREAQKLVPVDTGALKNSAFTRLE